MSTCHPVLRGLNGGVCVLCDTVAPSDPLEAEIAALDAEEAAARAELAALDRDAALASLAEFVRQGWHVLEGGELEWSWHHDAICENVQGMLEEWLRVRGDRRARRAWKQRWQRLILNICPTTLKSRITMVYAVAWMWLRCPEWQVLCVSATPENVYRDADACRDLITSTWYRATFKPTWAVRDDIDAKGKFQLTSGGFRMSKGMGGAFTGFHVDACFMDDPDDAFQVHSEVTRKSRRAKIESLSSRWNDKRHMVWIVIQQRVHVDDCSGDLASRGNWIQASYPLGTIAFTPASTPFFTDPRSGKAGDLIHPERFPPDVVNAAVGELGSAGFAAQYEQDPGAAGGSLVKLGWFKWFSVASWKLGETRRPAGARPDAAEVLELDRNGKLALDFLSISVDASFGSTSDTASDVAITVFGGKGTKRYIFEDDTKVRTFLETCADIAAKIAQWSPRFGGVIAVLVEKKANGAAVIETLQLEFQGLIAIEPDGGKESRAAAMSPAIESGCVYVLEGAPWIDVYLTGPTSVCAFPNGKKDDRMDALSQAMNHYRADIDAMKLAAKNAALMALRARQMRGMGAGLR